jgi:hypothetical protein
VRGRPGAEDRNGQCVIGRSRWHDPGDETAAAAHRRREPVDVVDDDGGIRGIPGEQDRQIDRHQRRAPDSERLEGMQPAAAAQHPLDQLGRQPVDARRGRRRRGPIAKAGVVHHPRHAAAQASRMASMSRR